MAIPLFRNTAPHEKSTTLIYPPKPRLQPRKRGCRSGAEKLAELGGNVTPEDLIALPKYHAVMRTPTDLSASLPSATLGRQ
jgi:hypothetical protein